MPPDGPMLPFARLHLVTLAFAAWSVAGAGAAVPDAGGLWLSGAGAGVAGPDVGGFLGAGSAGALERVAAALRGGEGPRQLQKEKGGCRSVAMRLLAPPALTAYQQCFADRQDVLSSFDWSIPGAALGAQVGCWCEANLTATIDEYECCEHRDLYPMCSVDCEPDCDSELAKQCISDCPAMCLESSEYTVDQGTCRKCDWVKCWPAIKCVLADAEADVQNGTLNKTCHEKKFKAGAALKNYEQCWRDAPKHSSHWNLWGSIVNCICREDMIPHLQNTTCCASKWYGGGACDVVCASETVCMGQEAQTCMHTCDAICTSFDVSPSKECLEKCLMVDAPCRKFLGCRMPTESGHVCDDGRWPEASSGCCQSNVEGSSRVQLGCPRLCDKSRVWRVDSTQAIPWWSRMSRGDGPALQCVCEGCPSSSKDAMEKLTDTLSDDLWLNGQDMLVDIARREGLTLGPNYQMQALMVQRNDKIRAVLADKSASTEKTSAAIASINSEYSALIREAAKKYGNTGPRKQDGRREGGDEKKRYVVFGVVTGVCLCFIIAVIGCATRLILKRKAAAAAQAPAMGFQTNGEVVIGSPVQEPGAVAGAVTGAPVTVSAPTKGGSATQTPKDVS